MPLSFTPTLFALPTAVSTVAVLALIGYLLVRERGSGLSWAFGFAGLTVAIWMGAYTLVYSAATPETARWCVRASYLGVPFIPASFYAFAVVLTGRLRRRRLAIALHVATAVAFTVAALSTNHLITGLERHAWGYYPSYQGGPLAVPFVLWFGFVLVLCLRELWTAYRTEPAPAHRTRLRLVVIAFAVAYLGAVDFAPKFGISVYPFGYAFLFAFLAITAWVVHRHRLVDLTATFAAGEIVSTMADALLVCDAEGYVRSVNDAVTSTFGYADDALLGRPLTALVHDEPVAAACLALARRPDAAPPKRLHDLETTCRTRGGATVDVSIAARPLRDHTGAAVGVVIILRDVRERKRAEAALRESERRFRTLFEHASDAVTVIGADGVVRQASSAAARVFGYEPERLIGMDALTSVHPGDIDRVRDAMARTLADGQTPRVEYRWRHEDGAWRWIESTGSNLMSDHGVGGILVTSRDVTERKEVQRALEQAKEAAEAATRAKSSFLANMSHEIRTPLHGIIATTGLLLGGRLGAEERELADIIRRSGDTLLDLVNDVLDFSKIEAGVLELEHEPFEVRGCIEAALDVVAVHAAQKGLELAYHVDEDVPWAVVGDGARMRQVLVNLVGNAVKFTDAGEVVVHAATAAGPDGAPQLRLSVRDTGIGIAEEKMDRLFRSFSQVDASTTRRYGGTGLGLAISNRLAESMGGRMWAESTAGRGSTFSFTVDAPAAPAAARRPACAGALDGRHVLVVDDNATNRRILTLQLERWGASVRSAASGPDALALLPGAPDFDFAVLDMQMPEMDGATLARALAAHRPAMPLLLLSSVDRPTDGTASLFDAVVPKPVKPAQLCGALLGVLGPNAADRPAGPDQAPQPVPADARGRPALRVLVAEDNPINRRVMQLVLERLGCAVELVGDGTQVLDALRRATFDLVLMDVHMPEMDGPAAARCITETWPPEHRPPVVALSADVTLQQRTTCLEAGMVDYLTKPVQEAELIRVLDRFAPPGEPRAHPAPAAEPPLDEADAPSLERVKALAGTDDPVLLASLLDGFLDDAARQVAHLDACGAAGDLAALQRVAHTLKSSSVLFGLHRLAALCDRIEHAPDLLAAAPLVPRASAAFAAHRRALDRNALLGRPVDDGVEADGEV